MAVALRAGCGAVSVPVRSISFVDVLACLEFSSFDPKDVGLGCVFLKIVLRKTFLKNIFFGRRRLKRRSEKTEVARSKRKH